MYSWLHQLVFKRFIYVYDAGYFGLVYAIKAMIAVCISAAICFSLFGQEVLIWSVMMAMYVFFLNGFTSNKDMDWKYLVLFVLFVCGLIPVFGLLDESLWLTLPSMAIAFCIGAGEAYDSDLPKVLSLGLISALVASIYAGSHPEVELWRCMGGAFVGGIISIGVRLFISFGQYGRFIQTQFVAILFEISTLCENLGRKDYEIIKLQTLNHISLLKAKLTSQSAKIKDTHLIKNHKRALFYLYKLESMCYAIDLLGYHFSHEKKPSTPLLQAKQEIVNNLRELSYIFYGKKPSLKKEALLYSLKKEKSSPWLNSLKIFYSKLESFTRISRQESLAFAENSNAKNLKELYTSLQNNPYPLLYGIRYAGAIGISMFVAQYFEINHGAWIALGVVTMMHPNISTIKALGKDSIIGSFVGVVIGFILVKVLWDTPLLYGIFIFNLFLVIYFKTYPFVLWSMVLMLELVIMFAIVDNNFIELVKYRFGDILIGFLFAFFVSKLIFPLYSADELQPKLKLSLEIFTTLNKESMRIIKSHDTQEHSLLVLDCQNRLLRTLNELDTLLKQSQKESKSHHSMQVMAFEELVAILYRLKETHALLWEKATSYTQNTHKDQPNAQESLLLDDLNSLRVRYDMLNAMIEFKPYYFKCDDEERFLYKDSQLAPLIREIFDFQNQIYTTLRQKLAKA